MIVRLDNATLPTSGPAAVVLAVLVLAGCTPAAASDVRAAAQEFQTAIREKHTQAACGMLSEEARSSLESTSVRSCPEALTALKLPAQRPTAIEVWGDNAQAKLPGGALFLAEFRSGWKIIGAGCQPRTDKPYACSVRS